MRLLDDLVIVLWPRLPMPQRLRSWLVWLLRPKFIVGVIALIADDAGRVLIGRHSYRWRRSWGPLGGSVGAEESLATALRRELLEEAGLDVEVGPLVAIIRGTEPRRLDLLFRCHVVRGTFAPSSEVPELRWVAADELARLLSPDDQWFAEIARQPPGAPVDYDRRIR